jgi:hypothetical protein
MNNSSTIKIGQLYTCTFETHGSIYKPQRVLRGGGTIVSWETNKLHLMEVHKLSAEEADNIRLIPIKVDSIVVPIEITDEEQLVKCLCGKKMLWFFLPLIIKNRVLVPFTE